MKSQKRIAMHLERILGAAKAALSFTEGIDRDAFLNDEKTQHAVAMTLVNLGEAVKTLRRDHLDYLGEHHEIAWQEITGMRHRIAHDYFQLNFGIVWETVRESLPQLAKKLPAMIAELDKKYPPMDFEPDSDT